MQAHMYLHGTHLMNSKCSNQCQSHNQQINLHLDSLSKAHEWNQTLKSFWKMWILNVLQSRFKNVNWTSIAIFKKVDRILVLFFKNVE